MNSYDFRYFRYFNTQQFVAVCSLRINHRVLKPIASYILKSLLTSHLLENDSAQESKHVDPERLLIFLLQNNGMSCVLSLKLIMHFDCFCYLVIVSYMELLVVLNKPVMFCINKIFKKTIKMKTRWNLNSNISVDCFIIIQYISYMQRSSSLQLINMILMTEKEAANLSQSTVQIKSIVPVCGASSAYALWLADFDSLCWFLYLCGQPVVTVIMIDNIKTHKLLQGLKFTVCMLLKGASNKCQAPHYWQLK